MISLLPVPGTKVAIGDAPATDRRQLVVRERILPRGTTAGFNHLDLAIHFCVVDNPVAIKVAVLGLATALGRAPRARNNLAQQPGG